MTRVILKSLTITKIKGFFYIILICATYVYVRIYIYTKNWYLIGGVNESVIIVIVFCGQKNVSKYKKLPNTQNIMVWRG